LSLPICFRGNLKPRTGYGTIPENLGRAVESLGHPVTFDDYGHNLHFHQLPPYVESRLHGFGPVRCAVHCAPPDVMFDPSDPTIFLTMWESSRPPINGAAHMNHALAVVVPCRWNADNFRAAGVTRPIHLMPLAIDTEAFTGQPRPLDSPTVFGMAARLVAGGCRKGLNEGMRAFADAFGPDEPVELRVRVWDDDLPFLDAPPDPRITVQTDPVPQAGLAGWYHGLTCLFVPSKGEGFGLHTLEAMACGVPVIAARYGGTAEFFDAESGWELAFDEVPATGLYEGCGLWAEPRHGAMVRALQQVHRQRSVATAKGLHAATVAATYTWDRAARTLLGVIDAMTAGTPA